MNKTQTLAAKIEALANKLRQTNAEQLNAEWLAGVEATLADWSTALSQSSAPHTAAPPQTLTRNGLIRIWCDGSCNPNPGPGGWGAIIEHNGQRHEISGAARIATNNTMEMSAALEALAQTPAGAQVVVATDSQYVVLGMSRWLQGWKKKGWRKADGQPVLNKDLWMRLDALAQERHVRWEWVQGHVGHPENERCDELANLARKNG